jgi:hypothetical protein
VSTTEGASVLLEKANTFVNLVRFTCVVTVGMGRRGRCGGSGTFVWLKELPESFGTEARTWSVVPGCQKGALHVGRVKERRTKGGLKVWCVKGLGHAKTRWSPRTKLEVTVIPLESV